ncbi:MAG: hypothetical protein R3C99_14655 [Pirellulaceae bacterium]
MVGSSSPVKALVPTDGSLGSDWLLPGFDDSAWLSGVGAVGYDQRDPNNLYDARIGLDVEATAFDQTGWSLFAIRSQSLIRTRGRIELDIAHDDGYVAYLNGVALSRQQTSAGSRRMEQQRYGLGMIYA